jgi:hypothetical protein
LFQSCVVYQKTSLSLEQAAKEQLKAKVKTNTNKTYKFQRIGFEDGEFYGLQKTKGEIVRVSLQDNEISKILLQDKTMSTILDIGLPVVGFVLIIGIITGLNADINPGFSGI